MDGIPTLPPRSIAILDRRPEYARMLASLAAEDHRDVPIRLFDCVDTAQQWIEGATGPVFVLADVSAANGTVIERAQQWRARIGIVLIAMFDQRVEDDVQRATMVEADATFAKPCCRAMWAHSFGAFLRDAVPDHAAPPEQRSA